MEGRTSEGEPVLLEHTWRARDLAIQGTHRQELLGIHRNSLDFLGCYKDLMRILTGFKASGGFLGSPREVLGSHRKS